jgi:hypothetical protein
MYLDAKKAGIRIFAFFRPRNFSTGSAAFAVNSVDGWPFSKTL